MTLAIRIARATDLKRIFTIRIRALADDIWTKIIYPHGRSESTLENGMKAWEAEMEDSSAILLVAIDHSSKEIVAFAKWYIFPDGCRNASWNSPYIPTSAGSEADNDIWHLFDEAKHNIRAKNIGAEPHAYLSYLCTDPDHQGKGAGSLLLRWGTDIADDAQLTCHLSSTHAGHNLYARRGFKNVETFEYDATKLGYSMRARLDFMSREPQHKA